MRRQPRCRHQEDISGPAWITEFQKEYKLELSSKLTWRENLQGKRRLSNSKSAMHNILKRIIFLNMLNRKISKKNCSYEPKWKSEACKECKKTKWARMPRQLAIHPLTRLGKSTRSSKWTSRPLGGRHQGYSTKSTRSILRSLRCLKKQKGWGTATPTNA